MCVEEHETGSAFQWATRHMRTAWACNQCILKPSLFFPHMQPWPPTTVPGTRVSLNVPSFSYWSFYQPEAQQGNK